MADKLEQTQQNFINNFEAKYGKLEKWVKIARKGGNKHSEMVKYLKTEHSLTHGYANMVALQALKAETGKDEKAGDPIDAMYAGPKAALRPIHEAVATAVRKLGTDVEFSPKKGYVSLRRNKQFGCIMPTTATRVDVGLILKGMKPAGRLEASTNEMFTHRVKVSSVKEVDKELIGWLKQAYDNA